MGSSGRDISGTVCPFGFKQAKGTPAGQMLSTSKIYRKSVDKYRLYRAVSVGDPQQQQQQQQKPIPTEDDFKIHQRQKDDIDGD